MDILFLTIVALFFISCWGLVKLCQSLREYSLLGAK